MPVNLSKPRSGPLQRWGETRPAAVGPEVGFFGVLLIALAAAAVSRATLPPDLLMPMLATLFLLFAAAFGAIAWRHRRMDPGGVTYRDVAGALTLIGLCVAAAIEPDQMVRLMQNDTAP